VTSRGCPHRCAYCINHVLAGIYADWCTMRRRSPENIIAEIRAVRARLPDIEAIDIRDEMFLASPRSYVATFSQGYREGVGLPFRANTSPATADPSKLRRLVEAGLQEIIMGIQSGAPRILQLYDRPFSNEQVMRAAESIHSLRCWTSPPRYDLITDNPYETDADRFETLRLVHRLPRPFKLSLYSLTLLPGTRLQERAVSDGLVDDEDRTPYQHSFNRIEGNCYNLLLMCHSWNLPGPVLRLVTHRAVFSLLSHPVFDRICAWTLRLLLTWRLRRNRKLLAQRRLRWLDSPKRGAA
jgi:anaerobic magnesium-protoporphyrin IX monomethyl ester cyclase